MTTLNFAVTFHGPFAVATGIPADGIDTTIDAHRPLPSSALKGLLRAQFMALVTALYANEDKEARAAIVDAIFSSGDSPGWVFSDGIVTLKKGLWTRVKVDDDGRADERFLMLGEQAFASEGKFTVSWEGRGEPPTEQVLALRAAARMITSLGSHRRRGLGWVSITDADEWTTDDSKALLDWLAKGTGK